VILTGDLAQPLQKALWLEPAAAVFSSWPGQSDPAGRPPTRRRRWTPCRRFLTVASTQVRRLFNDFASALPNGCLPPCSTCAAWAPTTPSPSCSKSAAAPSEGCCARSARSQGVGKVVNQGSDLRRCHRGDDAVGCPMCLCRWQRDRADALTWQGAERSPCRQGATRAAQGPDPGLCLPSPQVRPHVTDFADPLRPAPGPTRLRRHTCRHSVHHRQRGPRLAGSSPCRRQRHANKLILYRPPTRPT
jgi:hypothetical protein